MCTYVTEANSVVRTAKRNKTIYKILKVVNGDACISPYRFKFYSPNTVYSTEMDVHNFTAHSIVLNVQAGFHAFRTLKCARNHIWIARGNNAIVKMTIPKGAHYYIGLGNTIVSDAVQTGTMDRVD